MFRLYILQLRVENHHHDLRLMISIAGSLSEHRLSRYNPKYNYHST